MISSGMLVFILPCIVLLTTYLVFDAPLFQHLEKCFRHIFAAVGAGQLDAVQ